MYLLRLFCRVMDRVDNLDLLLVWCYPQNPDFHFAKLKIGCWINSLGLHLCSAHKHALISTKSLSWMQAFKLMYRPSGSAILWLIVQSIPFLNKIATPRELELPWQDIVWAPHSFLHWFSVAAIECVSCKKTRSALRLRHQRKMVLLLRKLLKPLTISDISLKAQNN